MYVYLRTRVLAFRVCRLACWFCVTSRVEIDKQPGLSNISTYHPVRHPGVFNCIGTFNNAASMGLACTCVQSWSAKYKIEVNRDVIESIDQSSRRLVYYSIQGDTSFLFTSDFETCWGYDLNFFSTVSGTNLEYVQIFCEIE